ncbi:hypothetical protein BASA61_004383 [Batrachochytrium salamandrivorans]|nr:hypothetical protein BASA61_004383 [Batrachochytrium salamandrivorans]
MAEPNSILEDRLNAFVGADIQVAVVPATDHHGNQNQSVPRSLSQPGPPQGSQDNLTTKTTAFSHNPPFQSVRDRIAQYRAVTGSASSINAAPSASNASNASNHHPMPRRQSLSTRTTPYARKQSTSGERPDLLGRPLGVETRSCAPTVASTPGPQRGGSSQPDKSVEAISATLHPMSISSHLGSNGRLQQMKEPSKPLVATGALASACRTNDTAASKLSPNQGSANALNACQSCSKTVYAMERVVVDTHVFHRACFKCTHCKGQLKMGNLASMGGVYYCKAHFKQLFALKGNYSEGFGKEEPKRAWLQEHGQGHQSPK